jgi:exonuclease III
MNIFLYSRYRKIYKTDNSLLYIIYKKQNIYITNYFLKNGVIKKEHKHLIQQKSRKVGGVGGGGDKLVLCSFNVYAWNGYRTNLKIFDYKFAKLIKEKGIELLLTQEDEISNNDDTSESVKAYLLNTIHSNRFSFTKCINSHNEGKLPFYRGVSPRNAIIIQDTVFGISIANLHLDGGRFVDLELDDDNFHKYLEIKVGLLKEVLKMSPDIIAGDFNSIYCTDADLLEKMYAAQKLYYDGDRNNEVQRIKKEQGKDEYGYSSNSFTRHIENYFNLNLINKCDNRSGDNKVFSLENIISWNSEPFTLLEDAGYEYIEPENIIMASGEINPTNFRGKNVIDHVWVKKSLHRNYTFSTKIYDDFGEAVNDLYGGVSDHKPVILTIQKRYSERTSKKPRIV